MKLGLNDCVNTETKKATLRLMGGGPSKVNPQNRHPSNPIHKAAAAESAKTPASQPQKTAAQTDTKPAVQPQAIEEPVPTAVSGSESHDLNKIAVALGAVAVGGLAFWTFR